VTKCRMHVIQHRRWNERGTIINEERHIDIIEHERTGIEAVIALPDSCPSSSLPSFPPSLPPFLPPFLTPVIKRVLTKSKGLVKRPTKPPVTAAALSSSRVVSS